ncbi:MAG: glycoside hydrolase family 57 protein, partial [Betaproteobacteria bacterium]|nr:glycoside hydrolase family 57 protein [Betaproteobacteria bacterium]
MSSVCLYFQVHQPVRLRRYTVFDIGQDHHYEDADMNCDILLRVAQKCYLPMNDLLLQLIRSHKKKFKISFSISGVCLEQFEQYAPEVIDSFRALSDTGCVEFLGETYHHSLAFLYSPEEFAGQIDLHARRIKELFGQKPKVFRNSELIYNNELARVVENMGYAAILAEGADHVLGWRSPNFAYSPVSCDTVKLLLKNYSLSDDIALRFSNTDWSEHPLTAQKYAKWIHDAAGTSDVVNLFMNYEVFGELHGEGSGIFDFMRAFPACILAQPGIKFATLSEAAKQLTPVARLDVPQFMSWADTERDLTAWNGNDMQRDALEALYRLESRVKASASGDLLLVWRKLQTSDHFYYMCTKWFAAGDVHRHFNPYGNPYDAYINFMNVLGDFELTLEKNAPANPAFVSLTGSTQARTRTGVKQKTKAAKAPAKKAGGRQAKAAEQSTPAREKKAEGAAGK